MKNLSKLFLEYGGKKYIFQVSLYTNDEKATANLDNNSFVMFKYQSELNSLVHTGEILYVDSYGVIDKFLERQYSSCRVMFLEVQHKIDAGVVIEKVSDANKYMADFLVESIDIIKRNSLTITYKIKLISSNIYSCLATVDYSNYKSGPESVFDIIKTCAIQSNIDIDILSFENILTNVKLNYITNGNDNMFSIVKYLMNKLYYYNEKDDSLKYIFWNESTLKLQLLDIKDLISYTGIYFIVLSLLNLKHENISLPELVNIGTVTKFPQSANMQEMFNRLIISYDMDKNQFKDEYLESKAMANYFNESSDPGGTTEKKQMFFERNDKFNCIKRGSYWNNEFNFYDSFSKYLTEGNSLITEVAGEILRKPGALVNVTIDRDTGNFTDEEKKTLKDKLTRYRGLEGNWITSKVCSYIFPATNRYRQVLTLVRNYTVDLENKENQN